MITDLWDGLGQRLSDRWITLWIPPLVFWAGGIYIWAIAHPHTWRGLDRLSGGAQALLWVGAVAVVALSALVAQRICAPLLRLLEGYWPGWLAPLRERLLGRQRRRLATGEARFQQLQELAVSTPESVDVTIELARLEHRLRQVPSAPHQIMPTRFGNLLRAFESAAGDKYGLDAVVCWPRLWLVLPEPARGELQRARGALDVIATVQLFAVLFVVWTPWIWWALPAGIVVAFLTVPWLHEAAARFGELVESVFDVHRFALYTALHWPLPGSPADEMPLGRALTSYLWRGSDAAEPTYVHSGAVTGGET